jgi:ATP-dependent Clp protease ATP-binding subunit ClpC
VEEGQQNKLMRLEEDLRKRVIGQDKALSIISKAIRRSRAGLHDIKRPMGSFVFLGPTGVGKTELAKALAERLFETEDALVRIDMSEYMEKFAVSRLIGAPPGYVGYDEGGQLTEKIRKKPYSVVLFDEIEKAHPDIFNILLQILDDGHLTDSYGRKVNFKNTIIIMTSNIGARDIRKNTSLGFQTPSEEDDYEKMKSKVLEEMKKVFNPEFINRLDETIVFYALGKEELLKIIDILIREVEGRLKQRKIILHFTPEAKELLFSKGFEPMLGARPLRRALQRYLEDPLSAELLQGRFPDGGDVWVDSNGQDLTFSDTENQFIASPSPEAVVQS